MQQNTPSQVFTAFTGWLEQQGPSKDQVFLERYLGTPRKVHLIKTAQLRLRARTIAKESGFSNTQWTELFGLLYQGEAFEHRLLAGMLLAQSLEYRATINLDKLERWLSQQVGWCEIDVTCQSGWTAQELLARWQEWQPFLTRLSESENISLRRASLVLLVSPLRMSNDDELTQQAVATIHALKKEKAVLITKAISWLLRSMTRQQPDYVRNFLDEYAEELPAIAVRETRRKLDTGRK